MTGEGWPAQTGTGISVQGSKSQLWDLEFQSPKTVAHTESIKMLHYSVKLWKEEVLGKGISLSLSLQFSHGLISWEFLDFFFIMNIICDGSHSPKYFWSLLVEPFPSATPLVGSQNPSTGLLHENMTPETSTDPADIAVWACGIIYNEYKCAL